jgi:hypothetical protein
MRVSGLAAAALGVGLLLALSAHAGPRYDFDRPQLESILADLQAWLPGAWDSYPQVWYERNVRMPEEGEHEHWYRSFALIDAPQVGDVVFYGQINVGGRDGPVLTRSEIIYKAWIDEQRGVVVVNGQPPADAQRFRDLQDHPELWAEVRMRDPDAINCDFIWRRDGEHLMAVLEGKTEERRKYGPGTCSYTSSSGAEFYADAEWVLTPEELWVYDINKIRDVQFIGRRDRTHTRLYRARDYRCTVDAGSGGVPEVHAAHDRGFFASLDKADDRQLGYTLLRARYPSADGSGLRDSLRLTLTSERAEKPLAMAEGPPAAPLISLSADRVAITCELR